MTGLTQAADDSVAYLARLWPGSLFGGMKRTQEMMDFCCANNVFPDIELVDSKQVLVPFVTYPNPSP